MSVIAERIQLNARRSSQYVDAFIVSDASVSAIIQDEADYEAYIECLEEEIKTLKEKLNGKEQ